MSATETDRNPGITGIILAGGAGRRMGGVDKGLLSLQGRALVEYVLEGLVPQVDDLIIVANRNLDSYREYGYPVISDPLPDFAGPLVGMLAGLDACSTPQALFVPADAPQLPVSLAGQLQAAGCPAIARGAAELQPLCCLLERAQLGALQTAVAAGERSPRKWLQDQAAVEVTFVDETHIWSVNTPEELSRLQQHPGLAA